MKDLSPSDLKTILHSKRTNYWFAGFVRRLGVSLMFGSAPPKSAKHRADSRSTKSCKHFCSKAEWSVIPLNSLAWASKFLSRSIVIRTSELPPFQSVYQYMPDCFALVNRINGQYFFGLPGQTVFKDQLLPELKQKYQIGGGCIDLREFAKSWHCKNCGMDFYNKNNKIFRKQAK